jgi:hypothetical protein
MLLLEFEIVVTSIHSKGGSNPGAANGADLAVAGQPDLQDPLIGLSPQVNGTYASID